MNNNVLNVLLIFAKYPTPGKVKTRLSPPLTLRESADLYRCMLRDTLEKTGQLPGVARMILFDGDPSCKEYFQTLAPDALVQQQAGTDLGERMQNACAQAFADGYRSAVIIGTDAPHLPVERIAEAFDLLEREDVDAVFGPSDDGGYYLLGMRQIRSELFRNIPWSSPDTLAVSLENAEDAGLKTAHLAGGYDLDTIADLLRLKREQSGPAGAADTLAFLIGLTVI